MTLRLALLLVSLILLGIIGLVCHHKYRQLNSKQRLGSSDAVGGTQALLDEDVNAPFLNENFVSDIPQQDESLLQPATEEITEQHQDPELKTSLEELLDEKKIAQSIAAELLSEYTTDELIFQHEAVIPNVNARLDQIKRITDAQQERLTNKVDVSAQLKKENDFTALDLIKRKKKISHLKAVIEFKQKLGVVGQQGLREFENFVQGTAQQLGCEYRFALTFDEAAAASKKLKLFLKENDLIVILYILAKPENSFMGAELHKAVTDAGLQYGDFKFFHYSAEQGENQNQKLFSLANMYKPGSFDLDVIENFSTMGLCVFMVPALLNDPVSGFNEMCTVCKRIADEMSGVLTTNKRELLDETNYKQICSRIIEHSRQLKEHNIIPGSELANQLFA